MRNRRKDHKNQNRHKPNKSHNYKEAEKKYAHTFTETHRKIFREKQEEEKKREQALAELRARKVICARCGQPIGEVAMAMADKKTGAPVHFDCVLDELRDKEILGTNERMAYIGQGRFGVLRFDNHRDTKHFKIVRIIEWEEKDAKFDWRNEMAGLYSQIL